MSDKRHGIDECRRIIVDSLGEDSVPADQVQVALWSDSSDGRKAFKNQVRTFANGLPRNPPGLNAEAFRSHVTGKSSQSESVSKIELGILCAIIMLSIIVTITGYSQSFLNLTIITGGAVLVVWEYVLLIQFVVQCGTWPSRFRLVGAWLAGVVLAYWLFIR